MATSPLPANWVKAQDLIFIFHTFEKSEKDIEETFLFGANVYIQKPSDFSELKHVLHKAVMTAFVYQEPPFNKANFLMRM